MVILEAENKIEYLRKERERICFPIINRGQLWYNKLSSEQYTELMNWYEAWLNITETLTIPETPSWVYNKIETEEIL